MLLYFVIMSVDDVISLLAESPTTHTELSVQLPSALYRETGLYDTHVRIPTKNSALMKM
jgi:hypothetical protein